MTVSPFLTTGSAGAPMCIDMGMTTCSGTGILLVGCPAVAFTCGTAAPLAERFRDLNNLISPVSLIFLAADGISAPPSVVDNYTDLLYHFSKACQATKYDKRSILHRTRKICNNLGNRRRIKGCIKINNPTKKTPGRCRSARVDTAGIGHARSLLLFTARSPAAAAAPEYKSSAPRPASQTGCPRSRRASGPQRTGSQCRCARGRS